MQTFKHTLGAITLAALALTGTAAQAQSVTNGTFDTDLSGWVNVNGGVAHSAFGGTAVFDRFADVLRQTFSLSGNQAYQLSFSYSSSNTSAFDGLTFDFNGAGYNPPPKTLSGTSFGVVNYVTTFTSSALGGNSTLVFRGVNNSFAQLDNVSITAVPEPETYAMLLAGLGAIGFMSRRRKNQQS
jgi:PEP-CTERM motif